MMKRRTTKNGPFRGRCVFKTIESLRPARLEACLAENRLATLGFGARLERNLALCATLCADCVMHLALAASAVLRLAGCAARLATLRGAETLGVVELLFTLGECERCAAIATRDILICHDMEKEKNECPPLNGLGGESWFPSRTTRTGF